MVLMLFGEQQARGIHVAAGDMGMNIDGAGHDDLAGDVMHFVRLPALRRGDDAAVFDPKIADLVSPVDRIDDTAAFQENQHLGVSTEVLRDFAGNGRYRRRGAWMRCLAGDNRSRLPRKLRGVMIYSRAADFDAHLRLARESGLRGDERDKRNICFFHGGASAP